VCPIAAPTGKSNKPNPNPHSTPMKAVAKTGDEYVSPSPLSFMITLNTPNPARLLGAV
jgi:hypothetical protein